ncbi:MAG: electron transfer flavoprotein subunit beta/FixA family protein [Acidimicrobiales bacterium]
MDVAVCVKLVADPAVPTLVVDGADRIGVEYALRLAEQAGGGVVTAVSMGPSVGGVGLRGVLAMGVDRMVLVSDDALAGSDALGTARVLAAAIVRLGVDLVVAGTESSDGYTGTMPVQLAELLGLPSVTFARRVGVADGRLVIERGREDGHDDIECPLPALVTISGSGVSLVPRRPTFAGLLAGRAKPVERLGLADLGLDPASVGRAGARQAVVSAVPVVRRRAGTLVADTGDAERRIIEALEGAGVA